MKTKTFFILCLISGIGLTQLSAQNGKNGNGAFITYEVWDNLWQPIYCNGVMIDELYGNLTCHRVNICKDGALVKSVERFEGEYTSSTGEKFTILSSHELDEFTPLLYNIWNWNLLGSSGTRYIGSIYLDENGGFKVSDGVCVENGPKKK